MTHFASIHLQSWLMPLISQTHANITINSDSAVDKATVVCFLLTLWIKYVPLPVFGLHPDNDAARRFPVLVAAPARVRLSMHGPCGCKLQNVLVWPFTVMILGTPFR